VGLINGQVHENELIMGLTERECRSALLMLACATTSLTSEDADDDDGLNLVQAAVAEDAARTAIRAVLAETRGIPVPTPALEVRGKPRPPKVTYIESRRERKEQPGGIA
jgi:hypothetical protein